MNRLIEFLAIRRGEGGAAARLISLMLATAIGSALGGAGIDALFFARFGVQYLPYMFLGLGVINMLTSFGLSALLGRVPRHVLYIFLPLVLALLLAGTRFALLTQAAPLYPLLWLGKEVINTLIGLIVWGAAGAVTDVRQAKRLFPLFNASRILGQTLGGLATGLFVASIGTENLILIWAGMMILAFGLMWSLLHRPQTMKFLRRKTRRKQPPLTTEMRRGYQFVRGSSLLRWMSLASILFSVLYFSIALPFSRAATERFADENTLASFLGLFNGLSTAAAFLVSLFFANRLISRYGIMTSLLIFPLIYLAGFGGLLVYSNFFIIIAFRFFQMLWLSGVADAAYQAMFNVAPPERRDQVRAFLDGIPGQMGVFIAGALLIVGERSLAPHQLYWIGFIAAALCFLVVWQARRGYIEALLDALRAGRSNFFFSEEKPFGGFQNDAVAIETVLRGIKNPDPVIRRVSFEIAGSLSLPDATKDIAGGLHDSDADVRSACLRALAASQAASALLDVAAALQDPQPEVRLEAVRAVSKLAAFAPGMLFHVAPLLEDADSRVSARAAVTILQSQPPRGIRIRGEGAEAILERAKQHLRYMAVFQDLSSRVDAILAMGEWRDAEAFDFLANELQERGLHPAEQRAILTSLTHIDSARALPYLAETLAHPNAAVRETAARLIGSIGGPALEAAFEALGQPASEEGALQALRYFPQLPAAKLLLLEGYARAAVAQAVKYQALMRGIRSSVRNEAGAFLADALQSKARNYGIRALDSIGLLGESETITLAVDYLRSNDMSQKAAVLETLDSMSDRWRPIVQPLIQLWESGEESRELRADTWQSLFADADAWLRACAVYAARKSAVAELQAILDDLARSDPDAFVRQTAHSAGDSMDTISTLTLMDCILFLRRVPLFEGLSPADLKQVASITKEVVFADGEILAEEGEAGDELYIIVSGEVQVTTTDEKGAAIELARRGPGDHVGEMAIITRAPRAASLTAVGDVRVLSIGQKAFEELMRERPDVSLAVIRILSERIKQNNELIEQLMKEAKK